MSEELINGRTKEYWDGVEEGGRHSKPSPETKAWMKEMEHQIKKTRQDLKDEIRSEFKEFRVELKKLQESNIINSLASKGFIAMIGLAVTAVFVAMINLALK